jgi:hypothetical protein
MTQTQRFCTQCGAELRAGNRFCGSCGHPVDQVAASTDQPAPPPSPQLRAAAQPAQPVAPQPVQPAPAGEPIVAIVPNLQQRRGFMGVKVSSYNMMVTPRRLVFVYISTDTMKAEVAEARREAKDEGKNWMGVVGAQMAWQGRLCAKLAEMGVEQALSRYAGSFSVANAEIIKVRLGGPSDDESNIQGEMRLETGVNKWKFELITEQPQKVKRLLQQTLGGLVK